MVFDEGYFHVRRGLPKWERIGHPIDTFSVFSAWVTSSLSPFQPKRSSSTSLLAAFSSILVTKDEFVHKDHCPASENWLHAILFTLHPITLTCAGFIWPVVQGVEVDPLDRPMARSTRIAPTLSLHAIWRNGPFYPLSNRILEYHMERQTGPKAINNDFYEDLAEHWYTAYDHPDRAPPR